MKDKKICPLLTIAGATYQEGIKYCEQDKCAWFDISCKCCIINALSCLTGIGM